MNKKGFSSGFMEGLAISLLLFAIIVIIIASVQLTQQFSQKAIREKISGSRQKIYDKTLHNTTNWLLNDLKGPLSERDRGKFLENIANGPDLVNTKYEKLLIVFATFDWPEAKSAKKLCDSMRGFIGLMETAEGSYINFAQEMFDESNEALEALISTEKVKPD